MLYCGNKRLGKGCIMNNMLQILSELFDETTSLVNYDKKMKMIHVIFLETEGNNIFRQICLKVWRKAYNTSDGRLAKRKKIFKRSEGARVAFLNEPDDPVFNKGIIKTWNGANLFEPADESSFNKGLIKNWIEPSLFEYPLRLRYFEIPGKISIDMPCKMILTSNKLPIIPNDDFTLRYNPSKRRNY